MSDASDDAMADRDERLFSRAVEEVARNVTRRAHQTYDYLRFDAICECLFSAKLDATQRAAFVERVFAGHDPVRI